MTRRKPYYEITEGRVKVTIWYEVVDGRTRFNVAFARLFTEADRWWDASCFRQEDMPALSRLASDVGLWIEQENLRLEAEATAADGGDNGGAA